MLDNRQVLALLFSSSGTKRCIVPPHAWNNQSDLFRTIISLTGHHNVSLRPISSEVALKPLLEYEKQVFVLLQQSRGKLFSGFATEAFQIWCPLCESRTNVGDRFLPKCKHQRRL